MWSLAPLTLATLRGALRTICASIAVQSLILLMWGIPVTPDTTWYSYLRYVLYGYLSQNNCRLSSLGNPAVDPPTSLTASPSNHNCESIEAIVKCQNFLRRQSVPRSCCRTCPNLPNPPDSIPQAKSLRSRCFHLVLMTSFFFLL